MAREAKRRRCQTRPLSTYSMMRSAGVCSASPDTCHILTSINNLLTLSHCPLCFQAHCSCGGASGPQIVARCLRLQLTLTFQLHPILLPPLIPLPLPLLMFLNLTQLVPLPLLPSLHPPLLPLPLLSLLCSFFSTSD